MTELTRTVRRRIGEFVIEAAPAGLIIKLAGSRTRYGPVSWSQLHTYAARLEADAQLARKRADRGLIGTERKARRR